MNYQLILTIWLILQMVVSLSSQPKLNKLKSETPAQLNGSIAGTALKFVGMFLCLYLGGFYS